MRLKKNAYLCIRNSGDALGRACGNAATGLSLVIGVWCNGNTTDSGPVILGSNPGSPTGKAKGRYGYRISLSVIRVRPRLVRAAAHAPMHDGLGQETAECRMECRRPIRKTAAITTAVRISDRGRASQMPTAPNALGSRIKLGIRNMNPRSMAKHVAGSTFPMLW